MYLIFCSKNRFPAFTYSYVSITYDTGNNFLVIITAKDANIRKNIYISRSALR